MRYNQALFTCILHCCICLFIHLPCAGQWMMVKNDSNFKVFLHEDWKENQSYKAEGIYDVPIDSLYQFLLTFSNYPKWVNYCSSVAVLQSKEDLHYVYYAFYDLPWPLANREAVSEIKIDRTSDGRIKVNSGPAEIVHTYNSRAVIVKNYHETFELIPIGNTKVLFKMQGNYHPGGFIPDWVVKKFLSEGPMDVMKKIRTELEYY